jgi:hypothetical protein
MENQHTLRTCAAARINPTGFLGNFLAQQELLIDSTPGARRLPILKGRTLFFPGDVCVKTMKIFLDKAPRSLIIQSLQSFLPPGHDEHLFSGVVPDFLAGLTLRAKLREARVGFRITDLSTANHRC